MGDGRIQLGVDRVLTDPSLLAGKRIGLVTNFTGVTGNLELSSRALLRAGVPIVALFSPEHGLRGTAQAGMSEASGDDEETGLPVVDTYRKSESDLDAAIAEHDLDVLVCDLQDIGARYYTYYATMLTCQRAAARAGVPFVVLDRPNPLGGTVVDGPGIRAGFESFIGPLSIPIRHGLTMGELARVGARLDSGAGIDVPQPTVIEMTGWERAMTWADTGLAWVPPSPNMPTPDTALAFVGTGPLEGTNLSEGRGTTRPFEIFGAPWLTADFADRLNAAGLPGVTFRTAWFTPTFSKHAGEVCCGAQLYVTDASRYPGLRVGIEILAAARESSQFAWLTPSHEEVGDRPPFIDLVWGSIDLRTLIDAGKTSALLEQLGEAATLRERDIELLSYQGKGQW
ncbi:hypothetical protein BSZ39_07725 [Bowdeniella nasicola]|uniref:DUF1343 domain-containing protein n=2 Tax=Bowdeniella nasicola TaxID=208480 RepID=A0A1Q5Q1L8_9ACTO|nr:hypothetical protein BSZ39_07725 [Bowdeniella nasicola]